EEGNALARGHGHRDSDALALQHALGRERAGERPLVPSLGPADPAQPEQQRQDDDDQLGPARQDAEDEPPRGDRDDREGQRREPHGHRDSSVFGAGTCVRRSSTTWVAESFVTQSSGCRISRWASAGPAIAFTSSGVTKSRPRSTALARASFKSARAP